MGPNSSAKYQFSFETVTAFNVTPPYLVYESWHIVYFEVKDLTSGVVLGGGDAVKYFVNGTSGPGNYELTVANRGSSGLLTYSFDLTTIAVPPSPVDLGLIDASGSASAPVEITGAFAINKTVDRYTFTLKSHDSVFISLQMIQGNTNYYPSVNLTADTGRIFRATELRKGYSYDSYTYDLGPGTYSLTMSGSNGVNWQTFTNYEMNVDVVSSERSLFSKGADKVDFNRLMDHQKRAIGLGGLSYDALGGDDSVTLPEEAAAILLAFDRQRRFDAGDGNDTIFGSSLGDYIVGGTENDKLMGMGDDDTLLGGMGDDTLDGGTGRDVIDGGDGSKDTTVIPYKLAELVHDRYGLRIGYSDIENRTEVTLVEDDKDTDKFLGVEYARFLVDPSKPSEPNVQRLVGTWAVPVPVEREEMNRQTLSNKTSLKLTSPTPSHVEQYLGKDTAVVIGVDIPKGEEALDPALHSVKVRGLKSATVSLAAVLANVNTQHPDLVSQLASHGMYVKRNVDETKTPSNHSWGIAIDLRIGPWLDMRLDDHMMKGLQTLVPFFNAAGWYSGATFTRNGRSREDSMHFEVSAETLGVWYDKDSAFGLRGPGLGGVDTDYARFDTTLGKRQRHLVLVDAAGDIDGTGNSLDNTLVGNNGANRLDGKAGKDILRGRDGNDFLNGGGGLDTLDGGLGLDTFMFDQKLVAGNVATIIGFKPEDDKIQIAKTIFTEVGDPGPLAADAFRGKGEGDASDRIIYNASTGALFYDADGGLTARTPIHFASIGKGLELSASDFEIV